MVSDVVGGEKWAIDHSVCAMPIWSIALSNAHVFGEF